MDAQESNTLSFSCGPISSGIGRSKKLCCNSITALLAGRGRIRFEVPAAQLTTFALGGPIGTLIEPGSIEGLAGVIHFLAQEGIKSRVLGAGSNLLIDDDGIDDPVIALGKPFSQWQVSTGDLEAEIRELFSGALSPATGKLPEVSSDLTLIAGAGTSLMSLSRITAQAGLSGLEFAAGIPASIGGAVWMNAGAHGSEIGSVISRIATLTSDGRLRILNRAELPFRYRRSGLPSDSIVVAAELKLKSGDAEEIQQLRSSCLDYRKRTQPLSLPSAGSVFRNPSSIKSEDGTPAAAGKLLDTLGFRGRRIGGVGFSELHANWLVKYPGTESAKASSASTLIAQAQTEVLETYGIELETEIIRWTQTES